jgi:hypothetical protein
MASCLIDAALLLRGAGQPAPCAALQAVEPGTSVLCCSQRFHSSNLMQVHDGRVIVRHIAAGASAERGDLPTTLPLRN